MERSRVSLKWLEAFQAVARHGSIRGGAQSLGLSMSTVSHHLGCLETTLGARLLDHSKRPMRLTPAGETLLRRVDEAMWILRKGVSDIWSSDLRSLIRLLRIAYIEDLETDVGPALVQTLSDAMPLCDFSVLTRPTHEVIDLLESEQVDIGVASSMASQRIGIIEDPIVHDPFIVVLPADVSHPITSVSALLGLQDTLPLIRHSRKQQIGQQIEAHLRRIKARFPERMEFESTHAILSMVAAKRGWTITTALAFARAERYHETLVALPFPGRAFSRTLALFCREDLPSSIRLLVERSLRDTLQRHVLDPVHEKYPWVRASLAMTQPREAVSTSGKADSSAALKS
ncbi:MAG: LysR family transcriptional regulator [Dinoroseobacter sp.]|nr:LysR family transcriptional regulator [Dinoroseobacter sp.]